MILKVRKIFYFYCIFIYILISIFIANDIKCFLFCNIVFNYYLKRINKVGFFDSFLFKKRIY